MDPGLHPTYQPTYESYPENTESHAVFNVAFVKSVGGILKLCEIVISCIMLICVAATDHWSSRSSGQWTNFVAALTLIIGALFYIFYLFNLIRKLRGPWIIIEFSALLISTIFWFITFIVDAANHSFGAGAIAAAIFSIAAVGVYIAELVTRFRVSKHEGGFRIIMTGVTTTTPSTYPHVTPVAGPPVHAHPAAHGDEARVDLSGNYVPSDRSDEGYVM